MSAQASKTSESHVFTVPIFVLAFLTLLTGLYDKGLNTGLPLYYDQAGYPSAFGGMLVAVYTLSCTISRLLGGMATDRFKHMRVLYASMGFLLVGVLLPMIWDNMIVVIVSRVLQGCGFALASNVISVLMQSLVPRASIGQASGLEGGGASLGMMFGATVATFSLDSLGYRGFFLVYAGIVILCTVGVFLIPRTRRFKEVQKANLQEEEAKEPDTLQAQVKVKTGPRSLIIDPILPYLGVSFAHRIIRGLCISFVLVYASFTHIAAGPVWFVISGLAMFVCRVAGGKFYDKAGAWWLFPIVTLNIVGFLLLFFLPNAITFYASAVFCGISIGSSSAFLRTLTAKAAPKSQWGLAVGELLFAGDIGLAAGAYLDGVLLDAFGKASFPQIAIGFDVFGAVMTFIVLLIGSRAAKKRNAK